MCKYFHGQIVLKVVLLDECDWNSMQFEWGVQQPPTRHNRFSKITTELRSTTWNCFQNRINSLIFYMALKSVLNQVYYPSKQF